MSLSSLETRSNNVVAIVMSQGEAASKQVQQILRDVRLEAIDHVAEYLQRSAEACLRSGKNSDYEFFMSQVRNLRSLKAEA